MAVQNYESAWREYRRINRWFVLVLLGYIPVFFSVGVLGEKLFESLAPMGAGFLVWGGLIYYYILRKMIWGCPRCGKRFAFWGWFPFFGMPSLERQCTHCGLRRHAKEAVECEDSDQLGLH